MEVFDAPAPYYPSEALSLDELAYWIAFSRVIGIGPVYFKRLLDFFHEEIRLAWKADRRDLAQAGLGQKLIESFLKQRAAIEPLHELERLERRRIRVITWKDATYPPALRKTPSAPFVLYTCGVLSREDQFALAIVGTRRMSAYGRLVTERFATDLAHGGVTVVSGLALGVDTVGHRYSHIKILLANAIAR
ncbi:MAG: DNA-processing protein DprA [Chloroflexota bacterium]|nr:DNA-processing protein DprA [Chloroflexota bacterium]